MTRAVVTGLGVAAPNGLGTEAFWKATLAGRTGLAPLTRFDATQYPSVLAGEIKGFVAEEHVPSRLMPQTDHMTRIALAAADWAIGDAGADLRRLPEYGMGVVTAASGGAVEFGQRELENLWSKGREHVSAYQSFAWFYAVNTGQISIRHKMRGPSGVLLTEQAGGIDALGHARRHIRKGIPLVVSGGVDAALCPWGWVPQIASGLMSTARDPDRAYLPFSADARGYVVGEGGAVIVVEDAASARERGAPRVYGEIAGYAATMDPAPGSGRPPGLRRAAENALADARLTPRDIDVVFADGAGVLALDRAEADAISGLFGPRGVPVTVPKTMTGRLLAGGAALDVATALLALRDGVIPPTVNVPDPAPDYGLDLVTDRPRDTAPRSALVLARGYGGFNAALVLRRTDDRPYDTDERTTACPQAPR
ncbi:MULTISPECIES: ketosynthase chain-length factor [Streptomyces]|uniref:Ketosynthase chain-length factor n=1 Tax=Streptomyces doudnae TaxID=3075536 RepID=A0ABD5ESB0_9ACTN|nr:MULTISPECIES: ketosynthase chain-length factor [unclassified Streptomyces]MDT0436282.1 ketosynthase chain-length factor [Streptomyces sp. DSM 41981]MYQ65237.1 ketosynthase chain-length factor [Streptomyces sp. SID4950]SCD95561.1 act minimal PKS chain-length factor (CLF/KS beta) [Streptomyces sp. SolWspMP-5a-2]